MKTPHILTTLVCVMCAHFSCLSVGEERAAEDERVGQASAQGLEVSVDQGLASVRSISETTLTLWGQAPALSVTLTAQTSRTLSITLRNAMPTAELTLDGAPIVRASQLATQHSWSVDLAANTPHTIRITPPDAMDASAPWRFVVFADVQEAIDHVQDLYDEMRRDPTIEFGLISGDLTETGTPEELERFQEEMKTLPFPLFATLGNHELGASETLFHEYFGRGNFSFGYRGARFTLLDSASATLSPRVYPWLDTWIKEAKDAPHLVMMHIPILDASGKRSGAFASRQEANTLLSTLAQGGVDLTIYGHVHTYETYQNAGIPAIITGGGGSIPMELDGVGRHILKIDIDPVNKSFAPAMVRIYPESL